MMEKLPNKFEMRTKYNHEKHYILTKQADGLFYKLVVKGSLEEAYDTPSSYTVRSVEDAVRFGAWIITKNLDEPEMKFPFAIEHHTTHNVYTISKGSQEGRVSMHDSAYDQTYPNAFSEAQAKVFIKEGIWIVKHVGEKAPEAPQSSEKSLATLTIDVDSTRVTEALEHVERLRQAYEDLAIAMESVMKLQKEWKGTL